MVGKAITAWLISTVTVAFVLLLAGVPRAQGGQSGSCCMTTQQYTVTCNSPSCNGKIYPRMCEPPVSYGWGDIFETTIVYCCTYPAPTVMNTGLICWVGSNGVEEQSQLAERVWVRDCRGRYALLTVPIRAYPA